MNRVSFLIDGFNLYHSVVDLQKIHKTGSKWLDIVKLCKSHLYILGNDARLEKVYYFSALAHHLLPSDSSRVQRHRVYIRCLQDTGVDVQLAKFKKKFYFCDRCHFKNKRHEEKETDVALASKLFELLQKDIADTVILVTGDTDLKQAVLTAKELFPAKTILFSFPFKRKNSELSIIAPGSFQLIRSMYETCIFSDPYILKNGKEIPKPKEW
ncbi:MAG: NYN domain-containing protein [Candidatus Marinimicrobia bacterium]|nr:NYN domain-containing protein [Candidatus Neomarinimicrobiota bacterium]